MRSRFIQNPMFRSLGFHLLLLLFAVFYMEKLAQPLSNYEPIEITFDDSKKEETKKVENSVENTVQQTVVQTSQGELADEAKKNSYLSDKTRTVKEERSAKNSGELAVLPHKTAIQDKPIPSPKKEVQLSDLGVKLATKEIKKFEQERNWVDNSQGESIQGGQYIQGMKEGEVSALNTKEFVFFSYFNRVRKQLNQAWAPILRENVSHLLKTGRHLASHSDFVTRTLVTMSDRGEIVKVKLLEESGTHDLDQAAVDALNKAGPYPNPPKGMINGSGVVELRWDFILKT